MPKPVSYKVCLEVNEAPETSKGGIVFAEETKKKYQQAMDIAKVLSIGPEAFYGLNGKKQDPWYKVGDHVFYVRYAGKELKLEDGRLLRIVNDTDVFAIAEPGEKIKGVEYGSA